MHYTYPLLTDFSDDYHFHTDQQQNMVVSVFVNSVILLTKDPCLRPPNSFFFFLITFLGRKRVFP